MAPDTFVAPRMSARTLQLTLWGVAFVAAVGVGCDRGAVVAQSPPGSGFVLTKVRVFDGERVHENTHVAVEGRVVRAVGGDLLRWAHLPAIDADGGTVIPGLIESHGHIRSLDDLRDATRFGVTTVVEVAAPVTPGEVAAFREADGPSTTSLISSLRASGHLFPVATVRSGPPSRRR